MNKRNAATRPSPTPCPLALSLCAAGLLSLPSLLHAQQAQDAPVQQVEVISTVPLPGLAQPRNQVPAPVQTATDADIERSRSRNLSEFMNRSLGAVHVNETQGNALQMDVNYRGFTASPLLGTPQGLSVYVDGMRVNQPFGDVVSWDLIPRGAIDTISLIPGSNPLFGLNTLGGALAIQTKSGLSHPGTSVEAVVGSHKRRELELQHGGSNDKGLHWFGLAHLQRDDGWRVDSPSDVRQFFGKLGWKEGRTAFDLSLMHANNDLHGNGLQEQRLLAQDWKSVYTKPDITRNRATQLNLQGQHETAGGIVFSGNAYARRIRTSTFNGDINEEALEDNPYLTNTGRGSSLRNRTWLANNGYAGQFPAAGETAANTPFPFWACVAQAGQAQNGGDAEPAEKCNALLNRSESKQQQSGLGGQASIPGVIAERRNRFTVGAAFDQSRVDYRQSTELGYLNPDRSVTGVNAFADGVNGGNVDGEPYDSRVDIKGRTRTWSVYATDTLSLADNLHFTLSGRYNHTRVETEDRINAPGSPSSLAGDHRFSRFNPAVGLTWSPTRSLNTYVGYNEGSRTPSVIELGCANPDQPCKLPNAMAGDPPLNQVVTKTWEAGVRGQSGTLRWRAGVFRATNHDDILFVSSSASGFGYFKNFGQTRRQGVELGLSERVGPLTLSANYTYLDATFQSPESVNGEANSSADADGNIQIRPGDRIPLVPRHLLKLGADYRLAPQWSVGASMLAIAGALARGNENGQHQADGSDYLGPGRSAGYAVFNLGTTFEPTEKVALTLQVNNLFDRRYATAAQLGATGFAANGNFVAPGVNSTFYAPGAPRTFWLGVKVSL
ncbi:TonB-dependent receptor [Azohydromonas australica]|uniref:TonB-dependent receptor n=1 Tax=Azohydromonas australica TaxID=364039 RepID=UPI0004262D6E|nr:TonB-dependent receptor [Azohydromonas australica]